MSRTIKISPKLVADAKEAAAGRQKVAMESTAIGAQFMGLVSRAVDLGAEFRASGEKVNESIKAIYEQYGTTEEDVEKLDLNEAVLVVKKG